MLDPNALATLLALAAVTAWTPGPNNLLVASSGATFGLRRTWPHVLGIGLGYPVMIFLVGFFLGELFQASAILRVALRWIGAAILLWIAWKIASAGGLTRAGKAPRPFTFLEAAAFQWINPKAWAMAIAITAQFVDPTAPLATALLVGVVFVLVGLSSATGWAIAGRAITRWINTDRRLRRFNIAMAASIAACVAVILVE